MARQHDRHVLVSWVSISAAAAPLLSVFADPGSRLCGRISDLYLCHRVAKQTDGSEREAFEKTCAQIAASPDATRPTLHPRPWRTTASPTDHEAIRGFAEDVLREIRATHPNATIHLHLSPGTPAMHAVWLLLGTTGFIAPPLSLLETLAPKDRRGVEDPVRRVVVDVDTWLRRIREQPRPTSPELTDDALWDPAEIRSDAARAVLRRVERWAPMPAPILLLGERGTGKTTLAHTIRAASPFQQRGGAPWAVVVCGQFQSNPELARAELFGHTKGAFTGATTARDGLLKGADGDTVFLDEIADLDFRTQRTLMAAVEGRGFQPIGSDKTEKPSFRLLAATNRPLAELRGGALDLDFLDRLSTFTLHLPALRDRREDLPVLWRSSVRRVAGALDRRVSVDALAQDRDALELLARHPLPGNMRDLQRAAWHAVAALAADEGLTAAVEAAAEALDEEPDAAPPDAEPHAAAFPIALDALLAQTEARWLRAALAAADDNKTRAAELVGLPRKTFASRLDKLDA